MRLIVITLYGALLLSGSALWSQTTSSGPILKEYGQVFAVPQAELILSTDKVHKILFDIYTDQGGEKEMNPLLNTVARFMNMHGQNGLKQDQMKIVVIMHGAALKNALNEKAYTDKYKIDNPNTDLIKALADVGVDFYACGQSVYSRGHKPEELAKPIKLSLSAMTALVHFQEEGYRLINFN